MTGIPENALPGKSMFFTHNSTFAGKRRQSFFDGGVGFRMRFSPSYPAFYEVFALDNEALPWVLFAIPWNGLSST
jgi:hypothetical protein